MQRFLVTIQGETLEDVEEIELLGLPDEGESIETKFGTCTVVSASAEPPGRQYAGKIRCSYP